MDHYEIEGVVAKEEKGCVGVCYVICLWAFASQSKQETEAVILFLRYSCLLLYRERYRYLFVREAEKN